MPEFAYVLGLDSTASSVTTSVNTQPESCAPTGTTRTVQGLILAAVKNLKTDLTLQSVVKLDDFQTPLDFVQRGVPTVLDDSVLYLTGIIGKTSKGPRSRSLSKLSLTRPFSRSRLAHCRSSRAFVLGWKCLRPDELGLHRWPHGFPLECVSPVNSRTSIARDQH